jgi:hypothetical protein
MHENYSRVLFSQCFIIPNISKFCLFQSANSSFEKVRMISENVFFKRNLDKKVSMSALK